jgi:hypothetical protein
MGIGMTGMSKAVRVPCTGEYVEGEYDVCLEEHLMIGVPARGKDGLKPGCYIAGKGGRTFDLDFSYAGYDMWIRRLSLLALGLEPQEVWDHPRRFRNKPFVELITFPDIDGGGIGRNTSAKLHENFVDFARTARRYYATSIPNVFAPPPLSSRSAEDKPHRNRVGLSSVVSLAAEIGGTVPGFNEGENLGWMWDKYQDFRRAFRLAKNAGLVIFY